MKKVAGTAESANLSMRQYSNREGREVPFVSDSAESERSANVSDGKADMHADAKSDGSVEPSNANGRRWLGGTRIARPLYVAQGLWAGAVRLTRKSDVSFFRRVLAPSSTFQPCSGRLSDVETPFGGVPDLRIFRLGERRLGSWRRWRAHGRSTGRRTWHGRSPRRSARRPRRTGGGSFQSRTSRRLAGQPSPHHRAERRQPRCPQAHVAGPRPTNRGRKRAARPTRPAPRPG